MRYQPLNIILLSTLLGCQTKHQNAVDDFAELEEREENESEPVAIEETVSLYNMDAGEGMKAKKEEGQSPVPEADVRQQLVFDKATAGKKDRKPSPEAPMAESTNMSLDSIGGLGGVIGAKGVQTRIAGLGTKGSQPRRDASGGGGASVAYSVSDSTSTKSLERKRGKAKGMPQTKKEIAVGAVMPSDMDSLIVEKPQETISNSEQYTDYGINPFVHTDEDALSTFSIDVDTASYTIARRKLKEGSLPNYASVRAEEFINFFDYAYTNKELSEGKPFDVSMNMMPHPFKEDREILRVGLQGMEYTVDSRPPLHLTFLVDVSGSMSSQDKLPLAKESMHMLVDTLREDDTVALATYAGNISKILDPTFGDNKRTIHAAIDRLNSGGSTAMSSGLDLAYEMAWNSFEPGAENRVIVLSDGDANVGRTGWTDMLSQIQSYADRGITMSTMGFGMGNYKDTRMEQLANKGDGNNYYIDSKSQAHRVFVEDFNSTMLSIARDVKIQVEFNPKTVQSYRLIGYENRDIADKDFRNDRVDAGEVGAGHTVTALYEVVLADEHRSSSKETLVTTRVRHEKPGPDSIATEHAWSISENEIQHRDHATELAFAAGTFAEIMRRSPYVSGISLTQLTEYTRDIVKRGNADEQELLSLMQLATDLNAGPSLVTR